MTRLQIPFLAVAAMAVLACGRQEVPDADSAAAATPPMSPAMVTVIETGKSIDASKRIVDTTSSFMPNDTLYVSVVTSNATPSTMVKAVVTFQDGQVVDSTSQTVAVPATMGGTSVTEFHLTKPGGWPTGDYTIEVWLDGQSAGTRTVAVRR
jgi:hypothetical protein